MVACPTAPFDSDIALREDVRISHLVRGFGLQHIDSVIGLGDKIRLVLQVFNARTIKQLELPLCRLEPLHGLALQDDSKLSLRVGLELLSGIKAAREPAKQVQR